MSGTEVTEEEILKDIISEDFEEVTPEMNDEVHAKEMEVEPEEEKSKVLSDEEIEDSQKSRVLEFVDEEEEGEEEGQEEEEGEKEPETISYEEYLTVKRAEAARQREIDRIREINRSLKDDVVSLRTEVEGIKSGIEQREEPQFDDKVLSDPAIQYIDHRLGKLEDRIPERSEEGGRNLAEIAQDIARYSTASAAAYKQHTPDWDEAHEFARAAAAKEQGIADDDPQRENKLNLLEQSLGYQWMEMGIDPAHQIYEFARQNGYKRGGATVNDDSRFDEQQEKRKAMSKSKTRRLKRGLAENSAAELESGPPRKRSGTISAARFYADYDKPTRMKIFSNHPDAFEQIANNQEISVAYLPQSR